MNVAVDRTGFAGASPAVMARMTTRQALGMPQLCLGGASETWLLKACGDIHWRLIAELAGRERPDFRDADGSPVYAAFSAVHAPHLALNGLAEHDGIEVNSEIFQVSRTRFASSHEISVGSRPAGRIELLSTFVRREAAGENRSIAKVALPDFPGRGFGPGPSGAARLAAALRKDLWLAHRGFAREDAVDVGRFEARPCPSQDFNGAGLLYFASYQAFVDRAEWELIDDAGLLTAVRSRDAVYYGNLQPGERLRVRLRALRRGPAGFDHWMTLESAGDGRKLAEVFTVRRDERRDGSI